jgi:hypothetical protein
MYDDNTIITFGRYKFTSLCRVPACYLLEENNHKVFNAELLEYIKENKEKLEARLVGNIVAPELKIPCDKLAYCSEKVAKEHINSINKKTYNHKTPVRAYECKTCGAWHLTSVSFEEWKNRKN